ncbi:hypothetical protein ACIJH7_003613 [Yersinia enterocolitica]
MQKIGNIPNTRADNNGEFTDGNVAGGVPPTILPAEWFNTIQRELISVLSAAGITPDSNEFNQVSKAVSKLITDGGFLKKVNNLSEIKTAGPVAVAQTLVNLGLDIALAGKQDKTSQLSIFATGSDVQILKLLGLDTALADKQPKDTTLTNLSGKNIAQLLDYLGLAAAGNTSGNLALIGDTKNQADKCAVIVKTGSNANGKYRIWSDGSIDMWGNGIANVNGDALVNYPIALPAAAQNVTTTPLVLSTGTNRPATSVMVVTDLTTATKATFIVKRSDGTTSADGFYWSVNYAAF